MADPLPRPQDVLRQFEWVTHPDIKDDLLNFVMYAFRWGAKGTDLEHISGPRDWQRDELNRISEHISNNKEILRKGDDPKVYYSATASGRGVGKSAIVSMINLWFLSCVTGGSAIICANTDSQLTDVTFGEIHKWRELCILGYWFESLTKYMSPAPWFTKQLKDKKGMSSSLYHLRGVLWDADRPGAFVGPHNVNGLIVTFDEADGIPKQIWKVVDGFFSERTIYRFWFAFSNPRQNTGAFYDCFNNPVSKDYWYTRQLDGRTVKESDQSNYEKILKEYGADSDEARVEVYGQFPEQGDKNFISRKLVQDAQSRVLDRYDYKDDPLVMGVDPARFGEDATVIRFRQGRNANIIEPIVLRKCDNMTVANKCADLISKYNPDGVFIDSGAGAGIIDRLREMGYKVFEVGFGTASGDAAYFDHRTELWAKMKEWMIGGVIDKDEKLEKDLCSPEYYYEGKGQDKIKLESKDDMKRRAGIKSTDHADALALTFHKKIARKDLNTSRSRKRTVIATGMDYKIFGS
jgi:hypothetical protein